MAAIREKWPRNTQNADITEIGVGNELYVG